MLPQLPPRLPRLLLEVRVHRALLTLHLMAVMSHHAHRTLLLLLTTTMMMTVVVQLPVRLMRHSLRVLTQPPLRGVGRWHCRRWRSCAGCWTQWRR